MLLSKKDSPLLPTNAEYGVKDGSAFMLRLIRHGHNAALDVPVPF